MFQRVKRNFKDQIEYVGLLLGFIAFFGYYLYLTFDYSQRETWFFPRVIIALGLLFVVIDLFTVAYADKIKSLLSSNEESILDEASSRETTEDVEARSYVFSLFKETGWLIGYLVGVYFIGFFTTTFLYSTLYIISHWEARNTKTVVMAVAIAAGLVGFLWILFVELMNSAAVFRLGYFI